MPAENNWSRGRVGPGASFLDPLVLQRIGSLELVARVVVEGFMQGLHRSRFMGNSMDFAEHRQYAPGDDLRRLDWKVYARTERLYVKEFEAETNTNFTVLLDCSKSMAFTNHTLTKLDYARYLSASLSFLARRQGDRVGILTFDSEVREVVPCSARHLDLVLHTIDRTKAERAGQFGPALKDIASRKNRKGFLAVVSDLYLDPEELRAPMSQLREIGSDVMVFHVLDPAELTFPYQGKITIEDLETDEFIPLAPEQLRAEYLRRLNAHVEAVGQVLGSTGADHVLVDTSKPLDEVLFRYLLARQDRKRRGSWASRS